MAECVLGSGIYDGRVFDSRLFPLAVYGIHPCDEDVVSGQLSQGIGRIDKGVIGMKSFGLKSIDFKFVDYIYSSYFCIKTDGYGNTFFIW